MERRRRQMLSALGTVSVVTLAGCGGDDGDETDAEEGDTDRPTDATRTGETDDDGTTDSPTEDVETTDQQDRPPFEQQTKLTATDGNNGDAFGEFVAMAGDGGTALIGARHDEDPNSERAGSAYVFAQSGNSWQQDGKLTASDGTRFDEFGSAVAIAGDGSITIVGADSDEDPNGAGVGSAYVFE